MSKKTELYAILRADLCAFAQWAFYKLYPGQAFDLNWHIEAINYCLMLAIKGQNNKLVVNLPPRYLKSFLISVVFPAWLLGRFPSKQIMCVSYSEDLSRKHSRDCRRLMECPEFKAIFQKSRINPNKNSETEFETTAGDFRLAVSMQGSITGRGCDVMIIDDPSKADDMRSAVERQRVKDIYDNTLFSRLNDKNKGVVILVMQRLHEDDLTQYLLDKGNFTHLCFPAIAIDDQLVLIGPYEQSYQRKAGEALCPARENIDTLQQIKKSMNSIEFEAQYQQQPITTAGAIFKRDSFRFLDEMPQYDKYSKIVCSWDLANKPGQSNDYSVGTIWGIIKNEYYLLDVIRVKLAYPELKHLVMDIAAKHMVQTILIEDMGIGTALIQDLSKSLNRVVIGIKPTKDKETRALGQTDLLEAGRVYFPKNASWLEILLHELTAFPRGKYDDQVDSLVQFLEWARNRAHELIIAMPISISRDSNERRGGYYY